MALYLIPGGKHRGKSAPALRRELAAAERRITQLLASLDQLAAERNQLERELDQASIDVSTVHDDLRIARGETDRALAALTATAADLANATAISDLPQHISTQPIPTLTQRFETGRVVRLGRSPMAGRTPQHTPSWVRTDTQPPTA
ncbi:hypothetical protein ACWD3J_14295 [Streptomyces sp. NPDC002755]